MKQNSKEGKKFKVILADCPWRYKSKNLKHGGALAHYPTMTIKDIKNLPVSEIAEDNSVLFLWATFPLLPEALEVIKSWGFKYKTGGFNWTKFNKKKPTPFLGCGFYTRSNGEVCLLSTRGKSLPRVSKSVSSVVFSPIARHSEKPQEVKQRIFQLYGDVSRIELFARKRSDDGWKYWGNEVNSDIKFPIDTNLAGIEKGESK